MGKTATIFNVRAAKWFACLCYWAPITATTTRQRHPSVPPLSNAGENSSTRTKQRLMNIDRKGQGISTVGPIELRMCANPEYLHVVRMLIRGVAQVVGLEDKDDLVTLAVEEAITNVIRHSYGGPCDKPIIVRLKRIDYGDEARPALEILIRDFGKQVDPEGIKGRDLSEFRPGGFGLHIIHTVMDEVEFSRAGDCGMQLRMIKCFS
jgi:serine/threonine-protein kinase RsbW